jgi:pimeloyl-ACP methyl ester carboxylesterase
MTEDQVLTDAPADAARDHGFRRRAKRILRVALVILAGLFVVLTLAAVVIDASPVGDPKPARSLYAGPYVQVGTTLVAYRSWGSQGTPIVMLGGAVEPTWVWHDVAPRLAAAGHRVYAIDLPPFGYTQRNVEPTMQGWLTLLHGFEQQLDISRPLLVGHSLGAGVAAAEALARPNDVAGIVMLDGDGLPFNRGGTWLAHLLVYPWYPAAFRVLSGRDWLVERILGNAWGPNPPHFSSATLDEFERPLRVTGTAAGLRALFGHGAPGVAHDDLTKIRVPRAVVWGADDDVDPISSGRESAAALDVPLRLVPGAGHLSMLANPAGVAELILRLGIAAR